MLTRAGAEWTAVASLATAVGTLVLAVATFWSVRSTNRVSRTAERALEVGLRPVLMPSRLQDAGQRVMWANRFGAEVCGGEATIHVRDGTIYVAVSLRNVGPGLAVVHGWHLYAQWRSGAHPHAPLDEFRAQRTDLYIPAADIGFWFTALREPDVVYQGMIDAISTRGMITVDLLYGDHEGGQRAISRLGVAPGDDGPTRWRCSAVRHWNIDRPDPRRLDPSSREPVTSA